MEHRLTIKGSLEDLNKFIAACNVSKFRGAKMKRDEETAIGWHIKQQLRGVKISNPVRVHIAWFEKDEKRDPDNVAFAKKFILDSLVSCGVLPIDTRKWINGFVDDIETDRENPRIEVVLVERSGDDGA